MAKFSFKALKRGGEKYEGVREAPSKFALYDIIKKEGGTVFAAQEIRGGAFLGGAIEMPALFSRVRTADKISFAKNLGSMIDAGLPLTRAISVIERQTRGKKFKQILQDLAASISRGEALSVALGKYPEVFSELFISMVKAGEESGSLKDSLRSLATQLEKSYLLNKKIRGALVYPGIIISIMIIIGIVMIVYVVPTITETFRELNIDLPFSTRFVIFTSDFLRGNAIVSILSVLVILAALILFGRSRVGKRFFDTVLLRLPLISPIVKEINSARMARTLSSLLSAGVDFLVAIRITTDVLQNSFYKKVMEKARATVEKGKPISEVFVAEERLYPIFVGEMAAIGEETGKLSEMFENVAVFYEEEVDQKTKNISTIIEPILMVLIGIVVGFFALSILSPIYSLVDVI